MLDVGDRLSEEGRRCVLRGEQQDRLNIAAFVPQAARKPRGDTNCVLAACRLYRLPSVSLSLMIPPSSLILGHSTSHSISSQYCNWSRFKKISITVIGGY